MRRFVESTPVTRSLINRFVAGTTVDDACTTTTNLVRSDCTVSLDCLGEDVHDSSAAERIVDEYLALLRKLESSDLAESTEVSVKLTAMGLLLEPDGEQQALSRTRRICEKASEIGVKVTIDTENPELVDPIFRIGHKLRQEFPSVGSVVQAYLRDSERRCHELAAEEARVRLCKGAYSASADLAYQQRQEIDDSYVRCLEVLVRGDGYPMLATHDPKMLAAAERAIRKQHRQPDSYEIQMLYGVRPDEQKRLVTAGHAMRVYVPFGTEWYGYLMRRLAERPANLMFFVRSLMSKS
ncbi:proline dehydrogenase family protein [Salinifilum aidingensis]